MSDELRKLAEGATPGPWEAHAPHGWMDDTYDEHLVFKAGDRSYEAQITPGGGEHGDDGLRPEDAAYIAAVSPDVVLGLLDRLEVAEGAVARVRAHLDRLDAVIERSGFDPLDVLKIDNLTEADRFGYLDGVRTVVNNLALVLEKPVEAPRSDEQHGKAPLPDPEDRRRRAALFNDITHTETKTWLMLSDRRAIADHLWAQGWRRNVRPEDVTETRERAPR